MRPSCERMAEEIAYLRGELGLQRDETEVLRLGEAFGLQRGPAQFLWALWRAKGRVVPHLQALDAIPGRTDRGPNLLSVYAHRLRSALGREAIVAIRGVGHRLSPAGLTRIVDALRSGDPHDER